MHDKMKNNIIKIDCAVIGGGFAGCTSALELADAGKEVMLFVKGKFEDCNSYLTAGGLTAVQKINNKSVKGDSFELHVNDTLKAGKNLNNKEVVRFCSEHFFPDVIKWLEKKGVKFDRNENGDYDLHREGGHSANRIFHVKDTTGNAIMKVLVGLVKKHPNIKVCEEHMAIDIITCNKFLKKKVKKDACIGLYVYDSKENSVKTIECKGTFIATGGLGKVFLYTSNQDVATGDGFAICYRLGLPLANMEFVQFHPTVFYDPSAINETERRFLLTEALRGAGAILKLSKESDEDFVLKYDSLGSKATRDVVTRAEDIEMRKHGLQHVWLDCTKIDSERLKNYFKNSYEFCLSRGIDMAKEPVPVVYAEHYSNGGVLVKKNSETSVSGLYAIGEVSYTGLHGATRLASNSAPECILFGRLAARHFLSILSNKENAKNVNIPAWNIGKVKEIKDKTTIQYYWEIVRRTMTSLCGISRNKERLMAAREVLLAIKKDINEFYWTYKVNKDFLEARNIADAALIILESTLVRKESRACHFREDFPETDNRNYKKLTVVKKGRKPAFRSI